ncbi:hypothetical protein POM88_041382 [Heracleum sosnowskyi]|uniref:OB domain-containing protein n=1 Tax=Heracleum sosnowskyi TaxID=360622 RepID=A0AAD8M9N6_9APIA|nr:hypothetical protein POM88_041382 [Heracleum sosnowskyi]
MQLYAFLCFHDQAESAVLLMGMKIESSPCILCCFVFYCCHIVEHMFISYNTTSYQALFIVWVKLVGMVVNKAERVTDVSLEIDDGTGRIDCTKWVNESADLKEMEGIMDGLYVCVHGHLKGFQGKKQLVIFCIRPVKDFNEITYHFNECAYVHHYNTKLRVQGGGPAAGHIPTPAASMCCGWKRCACVFFVMCVSNSKAVYFLF